MLVCDEPPRSNFARLADERAHRLGFAALSAPPLALQAAAQKGISPSPPTQKKAPIKRYLHSFEGEIYELNFALRARLQSHRKNHTPKQKASLFHRSCCGAIVRLHSCKSTNIAKKHRHHHTVMPVLFCERATKRIQNPNGFILQNRFTFYRKWVHFFCKKWVQI